MESIGFCFGETIFAVEEAAEEAEDTKEAEEA
jgi:hypothetical protein